ncbi:MAG TPA: lipid-binding SYLF domain-containing protein [Terriglobia bacterium]
MLRAVERLVQAILVVCLSATALQSAEKDANRLKAPADTLNEIMAAPDKGIDKDLMAKAVCAIVIPGLKKGAFIVGAKYGRGFASCREPKGGWTAPAGVQIEGGSFGLQVGGSGSDVVILVMNQDGMQHLLKSKFTLGGDASVAAGPVGRETAAQTDAMMHAEMLTWSRSRGVFAGISLDGATLRPDGDVNKALYGAGAMNKEILTGKYRVPTAAKVFVGALDKYSPKKAA